MRIVILECDRPGGDLAARFGTYATMIETWLAPALPEARFDRVFVAGGEPLPEPGSYDGVIISGAAAGVRDALPWMAPLIDHLRALAAARVPMTGICFGHQIMAEAFGGHVDRAPGGWNIGVQDHVPEPAAEGIFDPVALPAIAFHRDQVLQPPPAARVLFANAASAHDGFVYDFPAISMQFHPEFSPDFVRNLLNGGLGLRFSEEIVAAAFETLDDATASATLADGVARFFRGQRAD